MTHFLEFWDPSNIAGTNESGNFKFGTDMEGSEYEGENAKLGQKGSSGGHVTHFCAVTNIVHQNSDYLQFLSHAHMHTQQKLMTS